MSPTLTTCSSGTTVVTFSFSISYSFITAMYTTASFNCPAVMGGADPVPFVTARSKGLQEVKEANA
jgi:hypothetical protein